MEEQKVKFHEFEQEVKDEYTEAELRAMDEQLVGNMHKVETAMSANEYKLLSSSMNIDKMNELRLRQVDLGNTLSWLTQVRHNRCLMPLKKYEPKVRLIKPGI